MAERLRCLLAVCLIAAFGLAGCGGASPETAGVATPGASTPTLPPPTNTPEPLAARVNGEGILASEFESEVARFEAAQTQLGTDLATLGNYREEVLQGLIDRLLLAQGAREEGLDVSEEMAAQRFEQITQERGGSEAMGAWLAAQGYTLVGFQSSLRLDMLAAQMVESITAQVPETADQVHARHILVASQAVADDLRQQIVLGADFADLAVKNSLDLSTRLAGGDLGWFPEGYLTTPEVSELAFSLQPGDIGPVVQSSLGYHIVQTLERADRPLDPQALRTLQSDAVENWLAAKRQEAEVEVLTGP